MKNWISGLSLASLATMALSMGIANAEVPRLKVLDRMMYTINPNAKTSGPVFRDMADAATKSKYVSSLIAVILKEADSKAKKYIEAGDSQAYYAFLAMSLTVPLHEGLYIHFRNVDGDVCRSEANSGELVRKVNPLTYKIFTGTFKVPGREYFPNCETMSGRTGINQMIRGGDGTDLSMMQISIRWHFDDFLANKKYESVQQTLSYGLGHLLNGFDPVYRNVADYKCISEAGFQKKKINYINLIRGVWAGKYNSGSISQTCRFADPNSPFKNHDIGFAKNLDKILNFSGSIAPDYIGDIRVDPQTADVIREIISNLRKNKNERVELDKILSLN